MEVEGELVGGWGGGGGDGSAGLRLKVRSRKLEKWVSKIRAYMKTMKSIALHANFKTIQKKSYRNEYWSSDL